MDGRIVLNFLPGSEHNINLFMPNNPKHRLPHVLLGIKQRLNALLIQHLVLNDD